MGTITKQAKPAIIFLVIIFLALQGFGQDIPPRPDPPRLVNDLAGILSPEQAGQLESLLVAFNDSTSTQIAVVTVPSLNGYEKMDFAYRIGESWGIGQKGKNNGVVILVKPKTAAEKGDVAIAPGYGLEAVIPDVTAKRIVENEMIPRFREGDYYGGILAGVKTVMSLSKGEFTASQYNKRTSKGDHPYGMLIPIIIIAIVFLLVRASRARSYSMGRSLPFWTAFWLLGSMGGRSHSGNWNNFTNGSGGFSGGGGGFGGFGGGSFGGGGAGGSW